MFVYCTDVLHLCEGAAYNRIQAARTARKFPVDPRAACRRLADADRGSPARTAPHHRQLRARAQVGGARKETRARGACRIAGAEAGCCDGDSEAPAIVRNTYCDRARSGGCRRSLANPRAACPHRCQHPRMRRPVIQPLAPERYKLQLTIAKDTHDTLRQLQDLLRHSIPDGDPSRIVDRALKRLLEDVLRQKCAMTKRERQGAQRSSDSRDIPAAVRRAVLSAMAANVPLSVRTVAARSGRSWNTITVNPSLPVAKRPWRTSSCAAARTTRTRRSCSSHVTRCGSVGRRGRKFSAADKPAPKVPTNLETISASYSLATQFGIVKPTTSRILLNKALNHDCGAECIDWAV